MEIQWDGNNCPYIEWEQIPGIYKRAWVRIPTKGEKDGAGTGRYINVVRCNAPGRLGGNPADFPIFNDLPNEQVLLAFVHSVNAITGRRPKKDDEDGASSGA